MHGKETQKALITQLVQFQILQFRNVRLLPNPEMNRRRKN
jgi:hypothetical protein